jgi:hypothetical protein
MTVTTLNGLSNAVVITTPNSTLNLGTSGQDVTIDVNLGNANTWTAVQKLPSIYSDNGKITSDGSGDLTIYANLIVQQGATAYWQATPAFISTGNTKVTFGAYMGGTLQNNLVLSENTVSTIKNTLDDGSGNITASGTLTINGADSNNTGLIVNGVVNSYGAISGSSSITIGSGGLWLQANEGPLHDANHPAGIIYIGPYGGQWEAVDGNIGDSHTMSIALNVQTMPTVTLQNISFNTPTGIPIVTGAYGGNQRSILDDGSGNMTLFSGTDATSGSTLIDSPTLILEGQYWNSSSSVLYGGKLYWSQDSTTPTGHFSFNLNNNGTATEIAKLDQSGNLTNSGWSWQKGRNYGYFAPSDPTGTTSTTAKMMGLGSTLKLTPAFSGKVRIMFVCGANNSTTNSGVSAQLAFGTGTAPSNGAAATGTQFDRLRTISSAIASANQDLTFIVELSGLTVNTPYWFDVQLSVGSGGSGTASIHVISCIIEEI